MIQVSESMLEIYNGKYGDLFKPTPKSLPKSADSRLVKSFEEINDFYRKNGFAPHKDSDSFKEQSLGRRLLNLRNNPEKRKKLNVFDEFGLLKLVEKPKTMTELFTMEDDVFGGEIFDTSKLPKIREVKNKSNPDRKVSINNFATQYEALFKEQHALISIGRRKLKPFLTEKQLYTGGFYVYGGIMCYLEKIDKPTRMAGGHIQERTVTVFENGTMSRMFRRSLRQRLLDKKGYGFEVVDGDLPAGCIYVLKSLSQKDEIQMINNFYKIGFTTRSVEDRIKNAEADPTYLMAPVRIVAQYTVSSGINPRKIEHIIHAFFNSAKVKLSIVDHLGNKYEPDEWYSVSLDQIDKAVELLASGSIMDYFYDLESGEIKKK